MAIRIQVRRDSSANWTANNPILQIGEFGFDTTANRFKIGIASGETSRWNVLPYLNVIPSELTELAQDAVETAITAGTGITKTYNDNANTITLAVDNTIPNKTYVDTAISGLGNTVSTGYIPIGLLGNIDGVAELDSSGYVPQTQLTNTIDQLEGYVDSAVSGLINSAPSTLNTLKELSDALGADADFASTTAIALGTKITASSADTLSNKTINLESNTLRGTKDQFNSAITDADFVTLAGAEELTNKTLNSPIINQPTGIVKGDVGLGNVDNTSDADKPISTLTQTAITSINTSLDTKTNNLVTAVPTSNTSYPITASDLYKRVEFNSTSPITVVIPTDNTLNLPVGSSVELLQANTGKITVQAEGIGVSIYGPDNQFKSRVRWSSIFIEKRGANSWLITGDTEA
jgi:hypothetical protein